MAPPAGVEALTAALGDAGLLELVDADGTLVAVTLAAGRTRLHRIGPMRAADDLLDRVAFAVSRLLRPDLPATLHAAATTLLRDSAARADAALLHRMPELAGRPLVVVPTGSLQNVPWALLPSCAGRPVTVSPSATLWLGARSRPATPGHTLVAAGPALPGADGEARAVAAVHGVTPVLAADATADRVLRGLDGAALVHLAAHGRLAPHNPLFSELTLADGPLFAYDIEQLADAPHTVVLAACESGRSVVCAGDELLGLGAMFLARGASQLVASPLPVPDAETAPLMTAFHRRLAAGLPVAEALAQAQEQLRGAAPRTSRSPGSSASGRTRACAGGTGAADEDGAEARQDVRPRREQVARPSDVATAATPTTAAPAAAALTNRRPGEGRRRHVATVVTASATSQNAASPSHVRSACGPCRAPRRAPAPSAMSRAPAARPSTSPAGWVDDHPTHGVAASRGLTSAATPSAIRDAASARPPPCTSRFSSTRFRSLGSARGLGRARDDVRLRPLQHGRPPPALRGPHVRKATFMARRDRKVAFLAPEWACRRQIVSMYQAM